MLWPGGASRFSRLRKTVSVTKQFMNNLCL